MTNEASKMRVHRALVAASASVLLAASLALLLTAETQGSAYAPEGEHASLVTPPGYLENVTIPPIEPDFEVEEEEDSFLEDLLDHFPSDQNLGLSALDLFILTTACSLIIVAAVICVCWRRRVCSKE